MTSIPSREASKCFEDDSGRVRTTSKESGQTSASPRCASFCNLVRHAHLPQKTKVLHGPNGGLRWGENSEPGEKSKQTLEGSGQGQVTTRTSVQSSPPSKCLGGQGPCPGWRVHDDVQYFPQLVDLGLQFRLASCGLLEDGWAEPAASCWSITLCAPAWAPSLQGRYPHTEQGPLVPGLHLDA